MDNDFIDLMLPDYQDNKDDDYQYDYADDENEPYPGGYHVDYQDDKTDNNSAHRRLPVRRGWHVH